jgi:hypothetical protein
MDKIDFLIIDKQCEEALIELEVANSIEYWVLKYKNLFESISIQPTGLPSIANQHYQGIRYTFIGLFHSTYLKNLK